MKPSPGVVRPETFALLRRLMADEDLKHFFLVGGTALALYYGHRLSIDLDLFTLQRFDSERLREYASEAYGFRRTDQFNNGLMGFIDDIKVDFIRHAYTLVEPLHTDEDLRISSPLDIAAMKLNAICGNGTRVKDFYDMYVLLEHYPLQGMLVAYEQKYPDSGMPLAVRSLTYFDDVDLEREPALMARPVEFSAVRARLRQAVLEPFRTFGAE